MASFNIFEPPTKCDIKVGYISTDRGYVSGVGIHDANVYAKRNPGTTFIFATREKLQYLNINEVNKLTPNDLVSSADSCTGIEMNKKSDESPQIVFSGGGGVGAKANPIIGADGSLLGIDLVSGGFGYQYPPQVSMLDPTGIGAGAVIRAGIASTATVYQTYEDEEDFEDYDLKTCAPPIVGFGSMYVGGKNVGTWNPNQYLNNAISPFEIEVRKYINQIQQVQNPWWTTHTEPPKKVTGNGKTSRTFYKVTSPAWREFLNSYAISPVPPSNVKGSDFAGRWYTFEWDVEFPYDGEYRFIAQCDNDARFFLDNKPVSQFKIGEGGAAGSVLSNPLKFKETITGGEHNIRLELYNHHIKEKVAIQGSDAIREETTTEIVQQTVKSTRQETQIAGADFVRNSNGYFLKVGGNVETEVSLTLTYNDNPRTAGTAITKITIPNPDGDDIILEREKTGSGRFKQSGSVSVKGVFKRSEFGYGPFILEGNDGSSKLIKKNLTYGGNSARYGQIDFLDRHGSDTNASLKILAVKNLQESRIIETTKVVDVEVKSSEVVTSAKLSAVFNTVDFINKANRKLWRTNVNNNGGFVNEYGVCPFDTLNTLPDNPYAGTHEIVWNSVNFPVSGDYIIEIGVDDNVTLRIGNQVEIRKEGYVIESGRNKSTGILREIHYIKQGTYPIFAALEQIPGGRFGFGKIKSDGAVHDYSGKGLNPMALAIRIETSFEEKLKNIPKSWNYNPMGVAMSIEAPAPPIPQQPAPVKEGRCPPNPFWTTRSGGAKNQWHPVVVDGWSTFLNKYAMSPVPPFDDGSTSGGGILFENEWSVEIPYDGFYKLRGEADDIANFFVDGKLVLGTSRRDNKVKGESKFFLSEGTKRVRVQVENYLFEERKSIDQKIFNTADWINFDLPPLEKTKTVNFKVATNSAFINSIDIKGLFFEQGGSFVGDGETSRLVQLNTTVTKEVEIGREYIVEIKNAGQGVAGSLSPEVHALKSDGGVLMVEDIPSVPADKQGGITFDDLVCTASSGRFYDINKNVCKFKVDRGVASEIKGIVTGGTVRDGATYSGPKLATYSKGNLGPYLTPAFKDDQDYIDNFNGVTWIMKWDGVNFPETGAYNLKMQADDELKMRVDGREVGVAKVKQGVRTYNFNISTKGAKTIELELTNLDFNAKFNRNPAVASAIITRKASVAVKVDGKVKTKSWKENPIGVSAILIPPPCPNVVGGQGVVGPVIPTIPGNGYKPPTGPGYPVGLKLKEIIVEDPGINYNFDDPVEIDGPATAHICQMDSFGRIKKVCVDQPDESGTGGSGVGFTEYPSIGINSPTGSSARLIPVLEIVRDPVDPAIDPDKLIQVTDLVGINQTGYYDGRPYYGAVFYKNGIKYAGYYETAGQLVQIYDTLQESIDAEVTTPPSAILRQGTDIGSDNPGLDLPGTPNNLI